MKKILLIPVLLVVFTFKLQAQYHYKPTKPHEHHSSVTAIKTKHMHDPETPDPGMESRELKKRQRHARRERESYRLEKDKENVKYERKRLRHDRLSGTYVPFTKAGLKQHKRKLKEDKSRHAE